MSIFAPFGAASEPEDADDYDPSNCLCPDCGQTYSGTDRSGGHCRGGGYGGCCQSFASQHAADKHRIGPYSGPRRCLTPDELAAKGWAKDERGAWRTPPPAQPIQRKGSSQ